jgi:hypothetical protein
MKKPLLIITLFSICLSGKGQTWSALGSGINGDVFTNSSFVYALDTLNGSLYAGGTFDTAGGVFVNNIAEWNGVSWNAVGGGITSNLNGPHGVYALTTYKGNLYAGGQLILLA